VAATTTTIRGVQILTRKQARRADVFDLTLSMDGIAVQRPGRTAQQMGWDRISQWEIEERAGYVLLTLRGDGAVTPLVVRGWTLDDLELVMRDVTAGSRTEPAPDATAPTSTRVQTDATELARVEPDPAVRPEPAVPTRPRAERRAARRRTRRSSSPWKAVVTVTLLCVLAAAVALVLLQSAGIISWGLLGPTA
jgi:hypothetical protein